MHQRRVLTKPQVLFPPPRNTFNQTPTEQLIVYCLSPFVYLAGIVNVIFFLKGKHRASPPADILFFVSVFGLVRITSYLAAASIFFLI